MRRTIFLTVASLSILAAFPQVHLNAVCAPPPPASSVAGQNTMRQSAFIVWGTIDGTTVPKDAHAAHSFFLKVRGYFRGTGPARIEVSDYADGDLPVQASKPGSSLDASRQFVAHFAGQDAVVFATKEAPPYAGEYSTNLCTYTAYGDAASSDILPQVQSVFGAPLNPALPPTGSSPAALALAAIVLVAAGAALRSRVALRAGAERPECLVASPRAR